MNGIINVFKPKGISSHYLVNFIRIKTGVKRVGHTGTLDPNVSGVLPLCIGKATRVSEYLLESDKEYIGEITLGMRTNTQDGEGYVVEECDYRVDPKAVEKVFEKYTGEIEQVPPMYSALKYKGQKLYDIAREGKEVERKPRRIRIYENEVLEINDNKILFRVKCSKGTYVRTLCEDIARDLGTCGYMSHLIRTETDIFKLDQALGMDFITGLSLEELDKYIVPMDLPLEHMEKIMVDSGDYKRLAHGEIISFPDKDARKDIDYRVYYGDIFIGIGNLVVRDDKKLLKMKKVLLA